MRSRRLPPLFALAAVLWATAAPPAALAAEGAARVLRDEGHHMWLSWNSLTLATRRLDPTDPDKTRAFSGSWHVLSFAGDNLAGTGLEIAMGAWAMAELASGSAEGHVTDVIFGRVGWRNPDRTLYVRVGRLALYVGAPRYVFIDGGAATVFLPGGLRADAYAGWAVKELFEDMLEAPVTGARLAWVNWRWGHLGVAFQDVSRDAEMNRRTAGLDFTLRRFDPLTLSGYWAHDLLRGGLQEARLDANWSVNKWLDLFGRGELRDPLAWLPRFSIFHAFVQRTDGQAGLGFDLRTPGALSVRGHYDRIINAAGVPDGYAGELEARLHFDERHHDVVGVAGGLTNNGDNGYWHARAFGRSSPVHALTVSLDLDAYRFLRELNGYDRSVFAALAVQWELLEGFEVSVDARTWQNPWYERQGMILGHVDLNEKLFWRIDKEAAASRRRARAGGSGPGVEKRENQAGSTK